MGDAGIPPEDDYARTADWPVVTVLMFGASGTGKSTLGRALAGRLPRCAFIEVDALRYMVVGGLVAHSAGTRPEAAPEEYRRQCWLGVENAVRLARGFAYAGFSSVIEGLEDACRPGTGWIEAAFGDRPVHTVALVCEEAALTRRWQARGWGERLSPQARAEFEWYRQHRELFDSVVDTTTGTVAEHAAWLYDRCSFPFVAG